MATVLYIKANAKPEGQSNTFKVSDAFIESYKNTHPEDNIITLDLYEEKVHHLSGEDIVSIFDRETAKNRNHPIIKYAYQFAEVDKYVISAPMWNLSIPSILKAYIDYICIAGITFRYTEQGPVGLCVNKKAAHITTRGGSYSEGPAADFEMGDRYIRTILAFLGTTDVTTIAADKLNVIGENWDEIVRNAISEAQEKAKSF